MYAVLVKPVEGSMDISVICPVFDAEPAKLRRAIASVLAESGPTQRALAGPTPAEDRAAQIEIILVDDASTDPATLACLAAQQAPVRVIRRARNGGPASARNIGIAQAGGAWLGFLDADDLWCPGRIAASRPLMARPDVAWIAGRHHLLTPQGRLAAPWLMDQPGAGTRAGLTRLLLGNFWLHLGAMLVRRDVAQQVGGFAEGLRYFEDWLFAARLSTQVALHTLPRETYAWRREGGGLTGSVQRLAPASLAMFRVAGQDPLLRGFRRELRWGHYAAAKGLALNNLRAGRRASALWLALRAWLLDPREVADLAAFLRLAAQSPAGVRDNGSRYSRAEIFVGDQA